MTKRKLLALTDRLSKNIAAKRREIGLTQDRLAELVGVDTETISRFERGVTAPSLATLEKLAKKLGTTVATLLDEETPQPSTDAQAISIWLDGMKAKDRTFLIGLIRLYCQHYG